MGGRLLGGRRRVAVLGAACVLLAACGAGSAADGGATTEPLPTVDGVGRLPETGSPDPAATPTTTPTPPAAPDGPATTTGTVPFVPRDPRPPEAYVIDHGNGYPVTDPRVLMIGDSVLEATTFREPDDLDRYVATLGWRIWVDAYRGRHMDQGLDQLRDIVEGEIPWDTWAFAGAADGQGGVIPEVVVLMLGNNYEGLRAQFERDTAAMLQALSAARWIVLFTVPLYQPEQADVNEVLRAAARRDERVILVDWERLSREMEGVLQGDGLHPTTFGSAVLAQLIGRVLGPAPQVPVVVDLPVLGELTDGPLPDWTPEKARETVPELTAPPPSSPASTARQRPPKSTSPGTTPPQPTSPDPTTPEPTG